MRGFMLRRILRVWNEIMNRWLYIAPEELTRKLYISNDEISFVHFKIHRNFNLNV